MNKYLCISLFAWVLAACTPQNKGLTESDLYQSYAPDGIPFTVADSAWKADGQGNHRAVVKVTDAGKANAVQVTLPWRRPDMRPETKKVVVVDATTGQEVKNVNLRSFSSEVGVIAFEPVTVPGQYYVYYLPYQYRTGWNDARYGKPWNDYLPPVYEADSSWLASLPQEETSFAVAEVVGFESRSRFDAFTPMGTIATRQETDQLAEAHPENPVVFMEDRVFPIRLTSQLPVRWVKNGPSDRFEGYALRNEYYTWQIGVWAAREELKDVKLTFTDFIHTSGGATIPKEEVTCFNMGGTNWDGNPISFTVDIPKEKVQALWCGIQIPEEAEPGMYKGQVTLAAEGIAPRTLEVEIHVDKQLLADKGDADLWRHARLRWLNSRIGEDNHPVAPYQAMTVDGNMISATGKQVTVGKNGLPDAIRINGHDVLAEPFRFVLETSQGTIPFLAEEVRLSQEADGLVKWTASSEEKGITLRCDGYMEYDGYLRYQLAVSSATDLQIKDIRLISSYSPYASSYFMGTGYKGGACPASYTWDWKGPWDSYWMGGVEAGVQMEYRGGSYHGPLLNDYKPLPPSCWANEGKGTIRLNKGGTGSAGVTASTGNMNLAAGKVQTFEFALLITPVKAIDPAKHFSERYYHADWHKFDEAAEEGANIANIHHSQSLNPVINYPFIVQDSLKAFINHEHQYDRKVKIYYTIRELTNYTKEIYALKSLNHEIFTAGVGYGLPWHCEHLIDDYKPAWYTELPGETSDAALVLSGFSRWINYYLEGLRWMLENYELDGIYMDDVSFDRTVMKRMRKIMAEYRPGALIDLHSNTGYSIGPANQYTDFFPYVDRLWFGESFRYNEMMPDEWLVTFSGIPFGQMSEMLQDGGNPYLGMVYGTTTRHSYIKSRPAPIWSLWKSFGIEQARMQGYWDDACPVKTHSNLVKATAYVKEDSVLISLGNFDAKDQSVRLAIDWKALGMSPDKAKLVAPAVSGFQEETHFKPGDLIPVKSKEGWLLILTAQ